MWLVRAASHLQWLLSVSNLRGARADADAATDKLADDRLRALRLCEDEILIIGQAANRLRAHVEGTSGGKTNFSRRSSIVDGLLTSGTSYASSDGDPGGDGDTCTAQISKPSSFTGESPQA